MLSDKSLKMNRFTIFSLVFSCFLPLTSLTASEYWPEFRGPLGNGEAADSKVPTVFSETKNIRWKTPIHGKGWSSPVAWKDQIWVTTASEDGKEMFAVCIDSESGKVVRNLSVFKNPEPRFCHPTNSYASPTPIIEDGRIYVHFGSYGTAAIDTKTGERIWERRDIECNHWRGPGSSLVIHEDRIFVAYDGFDHQFVVAFDKNSGDTLWRKDRNIDYETTNGDLKKAYSTALVVQDANRTQVISASAMETISYDPNDGAELWRVRHGGMNAATRPVHRNGIVYLSPGDAGPNTLVAVRTDGSGKLSDENIAWKVKSGTSKRPSFILSDDLLFMVTDDGIAKCYEADSGKRVWQHRLGGNFRSSPIIANNLIYCFDQDGKAYVFAAEREFKLIAKNELENGCQASPGVLGNSLIVRTTKDLYRIEQID